MTKPQRIGIMGGTFDPPHLAHTLPVEIAAAEYHLDFVWFVPAFIPPHKQDQRRTDPFHRTAMLALALKGYQQFRISTLELLRGDISFTVDTVRTLHSEVEAQDRLFFIMGSDSFLEMHTWYAPAQLLSSCEWIIIDRGANRDDLIQQLNQLENRYQLLLKDSVHFASAPHFPFSSTEVRELLAEGKSASNMLLPDVEAYIQKHCLYRR